MLKKAIKNVRKIGTVNFCVGDVSKHWGLRKIVINLLEIEIIRDTCYVSGTEFPRE